MQQSNAPAKIPTAFAASGTKRTPAATSGGISTPEQPSWDVGWPIITETDPLLGGIPPGRQDFNGLGYALSGPAQWAQAGGNYPYDSSFSTAIGGYPKGARILASNGVDNWINTVENNTSNPDSGGAGWELAAVYSVTRWVLATEKQFGGIVGGSWHTAINAAASYALSNGLGLRLLPQSGGYPTTGAVVIPAGVPFDMRGTYLNLTGTPTSITATTSSGSNQLTSVSVVFGALSVGQPVAGPGIPAGATIAGGSGATWTINTNATANGSGVSIVAGPYAIPVVLTIGTVGTANLYMPLLGLDVRNGASTAAWTSPTTAWPRTMTAVTATTASGSNQLTSVSAALAVGQLLVGAGIPFGTTVVSGGSGTYTMSTNATASASGVSISAETLNSGFTAIEIIEANHCEIEHASSQKFTRGLVFSSYSRPFAYNKQIRLRLLQDCKYGLMLVTVGANGGVQFANENASTGGEFENSSISNSWGDSVGVVITRDIANNAYSGQNNNHFKDSCFELGSSTPYNRIPVWLCGAGGSNKFVDIRSESNDGWCAVIDGIGLALSQNEITCSFDNSVAQSFQSILELNGAVANHYYSGFVEQRFKTCWNSGNLLDSVTSYAANAPYINGPMHFASSAGATFARTVTNVALKTYNDSVAVPNGVGIGVFVDTSSIKRFIVRISARSGFGGRIALQCFDASGAILTGSGANSPYVRSTGPLSYNTSYGGAWLTGSDGANNFPITFGADVQKARIIIAGGTNDAILKSIELIGLMDKQDSTGANATAAMVVYSGLPGDECRMASAKPDVAGQHGYYALGQQIQNAAAAVGQPGYWTAITNAVGYLAKTWAISTAYTRTGDTVVNGANVYYLVTPGTSASSGGPTGTGAGITDGTCVWNYLGPKAVFATAPNLV